MKSSNELPLQEQGSTPHADHSAAFPPREPAGYADHDGDTNDGSILEDDVARKRGKQAAGRYQPETKWRYNRTIFNQGITAAGTIVYKGTDPETAEHRFLLRHGWFVDGQRRTASKQVTASNASEAERKLGAWVQELRSGRILPRVVLTLGEYVEGPWRTRRLPRLAGSTLKSYDEIWNSRIKPFLGHLRIDQLTRGTVSDWVAKNGSGQTVTLTRRGSNGASFERQIRLSSKPRRVKNAKALLTTILGDLVDDGYLTQTPMPRPPRRKSRKESAEVQEVDNARDEEYWTRDEVAAFWAAGLPVARREQVLKYPRLRTARERRNGQSETRLDIMDPYGATLTFLFGAFGLAFGTRPGEGCAARWEDLEKAEDGWLLHVRASIGVPDADRLAVAGCPAWDRTLTKTGIKARVSDCSGFVDRYLLPFKAVQDDLLAAGKMQNPHGYIFARPDGQFYNPNRIREKWLQLLSGLGLRPITPYGLRHTHATLLLEDGVSINAISERLRHRDVTVTAKVYAHVTARLQQRTAGQVSAAGLVPAPNTASRAESDGAESDELTRVAIPGVLSFRDWRRRKEA